MRQTSVVLGLLGLMTLTTAAAAFEDTDMLPAGVRNIDLKTVNTDFNEKTDANGARKPLSTPLQQQLTFDKIAKGEDALKAKQLRAFMASNGIAATDSVGQFTADMKGHLSVVAPVISYGVTDSFNFGVAIPVYSATSSVSVGFQPNSNAQAFLTKLSDPKNNQTASARDAATQLNGAVAQLNKQLHQNNYRAITDWHAQGLGDMTLAGKYRYLDTSRVGVASLTGLVAPTGRQHDPDVLTDIPFGNGVWAPFMEGIVDEKLGAGFILNQFGKYTNQLPGEKVVRAETAQEQVNVPEQSTAYKLGDMFDTGASLRYNPSFGLLSAVGGTFHHKYRDIYKEVGGDTKSYLQQDTEQKSTTADVLLGYSTVPLYFAHQFPVPLDLRLSYSRQLMSRNTPVTDLAQLDFNLYF